MVKKTLNLTLLLLAIAFLVEACSTPADSGSQTAERSILEPPVVTKIPVDVVEVQREDVVETLELTGAVQPWDEFAISSEIMGTVVAVHFDQGDWVEKGDLLLELDTRKLELRLSSRKAELKRAQIELEFAKKHLQRAHSLLEKGAISRSEVDTLEERVDLSSSAVAVSSLAVESVQEDLRDTLLFSPAMGQISRRLISLGETVNPASVLFELIQLEPIKVVTEITEPYLAEVRPGQSVQLELDAFPNERFTGHVRKIHPVATVESGAFPLEIRLANTRRRLQAGMIARIALTGKVFTGALVVPLVSVVNLQGENFVFVVHDGHAHRRLISVRERIGDIAVIEADLEPGEKVVVRGTSNLTDGTPVELIA